MLRVKKQAAASYDRAQLLFCCEGPAQFATPFVSASDFAADYHPMLVVLVPPFGCPRSLEYKLYIHAYGSLAQQPLIQEAYRVLGSSSTVV
jgi:hypothetical protein